MGEGQPLQRQGGGSHTRTMPARLITHLAQAAITLAGVAIIVFVLLRVVPGDPIAMMISPGASAQDIANLRKLYGLDASILEQFRIWVLGLLSGDFGISISQKRAVGGIILQRLPATLEMAGLALAAAVLLGGLIAVAGTALRRRAGETVVDAVNGLLLAIPDFVWALGLVLLFAVAWPVLPLTDRIDRSLDVSFASRFYLLESLITGQFAVAGNILRHMVMPVLALALPLAAVIARVLKEALIEAMGQDYVLLARIKGMGEARLILQEALRNAAGPALALTGVQFTFLIGGTVIVERIFSYPGLGNMAVDAVINRDLPLIQGLILMFGALFIVVNLATDAAAAALNPRLRVA